METPGKIRENHENVRKNPENLGRIMEEHRIIRENHLRMKD